MVGETVNNIKCKVYFKKNRKAVGMMGKRTNKNGNVHFCTPVLPKAFPKTIACL